MTEEIDVANYQKALRTIRLGKFSKRTKFREKTNWAQYQTR
jgi:hypothetical protein